METQDYDISEIFAKAGEKYGYDNVEAEYADFDELKMKWMRHGTWARFFVSDFMRDAPREVMESMAETLLAKICCSAETEYSEAVCRWLTAEEFVRSKQPVYLSKKEGMVAGSEGRFKDLGTSYRRLVDAGMLKEDPMLYIGWDYSYPERGAGRASVLMRVVGVSPELDSEGISDRALDYALYSLALHVSLGFAPCRRSRDTDYEEIMGRYPDRDAVVEELAERGISLRGVPRALTRRITVRR
ncbi:MAG: hypothetical protein IKP53_05750 [Candidatus Methanomethylophilaceae archaeon]|jgi:hypothetical protein|nr:hypothetical protein [Candidatus Methanomethylophilaceae archaeon]MBR7006505.1 hypothetical protein [Candidatus Methanomethylophilaceae archaeon]